MVAVTARMRLAKAGLNEEPDMMSLLNGIVTYAGETVLTMMTSFEKVSLDTILFYL
jgi:hypothetical protein